MKDAKDKTVSEVCVRACARVCVCLHLHVCVYVDLHMHVRLFVANEIQRMFK